MIDSPRFVIGFFILRPGLSECRIQGRVSRPRQTCGSPSKLPAQVLNGQHGNGGAGIDMLLRHREVTARSDDVQ